MTRNSTIARPLFALAAALACAPLAAKEPVVVTGQPVYQERVDFADLDLRQSRARQTLFRRVMRASTEVCIRFEGKINIDKVMGGARNTCPNRTYRVARPQIMAAIRRANSGQPQPALALVVAAPTAAR
jgi:UrcA family protein